MNLTLTRALVRHIIETNRTTKWNMRSNGQFCPALDDRYQINIFDPSAAAEGRNDAHTHPRGFRSRTIAGSMRQIRYHKEETDQTTHIGVRLTPDYTLLGWECYELSQITSECYIPGEAYNIYAAEVHSADPTPGTVAAMRLKCLNCGHIHPNFRQTACCSLARIAEGSELEASLAAGTLVNFSDKIAKTIANRIITSAQKDTEMIAKSASAAAETTICQWEYNKNRFELRKDFREKIEAAADVAIHDQANKAIVSRFAEEELVKRINFIIEERLFGYINKQIDACIAKYASQIDLSAKIGSAIMDRLKG